MNKYRILELANKIETLEHVTDFETVPVDGFNMEIFNFSNPLSGCRTPACICGWAKELWGRKDLQDKRTSRKDGRYLLDLTDDEANKLFFPQDSCRRTPKEAAGVLRNFAATGEIEWSDLPQPQPTDEIKEMP